MLKIEEKFMETVQSVLKAKMKKEKDHYRVLLVNNKDYERRLSLEVYPDFQGTPDALVVVYTPNSHLQLHHCNRIEISDFLGEVTFISEKDDLVSAIVVEETGGCSLYSSVDKKILSGDYTQLGVEVMLAGVAHDLND